MAFVKLDCGILESSLWIDRAAREVFITALLMATPRQLECPLEQLDARTMKPTGWMIPEGWYGWVDASGVGICRRALVDQEEGLSALERLGSPEAESRTSDFDGRRLVRCNGGYIVLNYMRFRERDDGAADRMRLYRQRKKSQAIDSASELRVTVTPLRRTVTEAEAEAEAEKKQIIGHPPPAFDRFWEVYPKKVKRKPASELWKRKALDRLADSICADVTSRLSNDRRWKDGYVPDPTTYLQQERWNDEITQKAERWV